MGFTKPIEQYLCSNLLTRIHLFMYLKDIIRGVERMCKELEDLIKLATKDARKEIAISLAKMGMPAEQIAEVVEIKAATVRLWLDKDLNPIKE